MTVKKVGKSFELVGGKGKNLGKSKTKAGAIKREKQVTFFKNNKQYIKDHGRPIPRGKKK